MLEKNQTISIDEIKTILELKGPLLILSSADNNLKLQFGNSEDFSTALFKLEKNGIYPKEGSNKDLALTINQEKFKDFLIKNSSMMTKPIANTEKVSAFMNFNNWLQSKKPDLTNTTPPLLLSLPYDLIVVVMKFLDRYGDRLSFALCMVSAYFEYDHQKHPIQLSATKANAKVHYSRFFKVANAVKNTLLADGFYFNSNEGLFGWGFNTFGQLGLGHTACQDTPYPITALKGKKVISVASEGDRSLFITDKGEVFTCGDNRFGQLGLGHQNEVNSPQLITALKDHKIISASANLRHSLFLTQEGKVFSCGDNYFGQLGLNDETMIPQQITALDSHKIISLSAGPSAHSLF